MDAVADRRSQRWLLQHKTQFVENKWVREINKPICHIVIKSAKSSNKAEIHNFLLYPISESYSEKENLL